MGDLVQLEMDSMWSGLRLSVISKAIIRLTRVTRTQPISGCLEVNVLSNILCLEGGELALDPFSGY